MPYKADNQNANYKITLGSVKVGKTYTYTFYLNLGRRRSPLMRWDASAVHMQTTVNNMLGGRAGTKCRRFDTDKVGKRIYGEEISTSWAGYEWFCFFPHALNIRGYRMTFSYN